MVSSLEPSLSLPTLFFIGGCLALNYRYNATVSLLGRTFCSVLANDCGSSFRHTLQICGYNTPRSIEKYPSGALLEVFWSSVECCLPLLPWNMKYQAFSPSVRVCGGVIVVTVVTENYLTLTSATSSICIDKRRNNLNWLNVMV